MNFVIVVSEHVHLVPSEDGQLTETCKGSKYLQIETLMYRLCISNKEKYLFNVSLTVIRI
jgi:hypothetical protein